MTPTDLMLLAYADGELDAAAVEEVERLLATDAQARRVVDMYRETASLLRAACGETVYEPQTLRLLPSAQALGAWPRRRAVWAAAACLGLGLVLGAGGTVLGMRRSEMASFVSEIAEYYGVFARDPAHLSEIPAEREQELVAWLSRRLERRLEIPDLEPEGLHFAGGRMLVIDGSPVAQLMYTPVQGLPVAVCIGRMAGAPLAAETQISGALQIVAWRQDGYAYVVIGEIPGDLARAVAERVRTQLHG